MYYTIIITSGIKTTKKDQNNYKHCSHGHYIAMASCLHLKIKNNSKVGKSKILYLYNNSVFYSQEVIL